MKEFFFTVDGRRERVQMARIGSDVWVHRAGETWVVSQLPKKANVDTTAAGDFSGSLLAPMPGKILKLNAKVGDAIAPNQVVVIMEAMKMEYTLASPEAGVLTELNCREGQQVELGEKLAFVKVGGEKK